MLRITIRTDSVATHYIIEGKLAGPAVVELERCWQAAVCNESHSPILVDLTSATCIDARGKQLLAQMHQNGARLKGTGLMTEFIIEEIEKQKQRDGA